MKHYRLFLTALAAVFSLGLSAQSWTADEVGEGPSLLYNVGTGQYFSRGNGWGTQASINPLKGALAVDIALVDGKYFLRTGLANSEYGLENLNGGTIYTDQSRGKKSTWTFELVGDDNGPVYNIISADNHGGGDGAYLTAEGGESTIIGPGTDGSLDNAKWKVFSITAERERILEAMADATESNPVDATLLIDDADFNLSLFQGSWKMEASNQNLNGGEWSNPCAESWKATFTLSQTINVPNGVYKLRAQAALTDYTGSGENWPVVYVNDEKVSFQEMTDGENSMSTMSGKFAEGKYYTDYMEVVVTDGKLTFGTKGTRTDTWCIWDNFELQYLGELTDFSMLEEALAAAVADAEALEELIPPAAYDELSAIVAANDKSYSSAEGYTEAIKAIKDATEDAKVLIAPYAELVAENEKAGALGVETVDYEAGMTPDDIRAAVKGLKVSEYEYVMENYTTAIDLGEWTQEGGTTFNYGGQHWSGENRGYWEQTTANYSASSWNISFNQTISLPAGDYVFKVAGRHASGAVTMGLTVSNANTEASIGTVNDFPSGDIGKGIDTSGATNFDESGTYANDNKGRGWQWRYVPFTLTEETSVKIAVEAEASAKYQWISFCDYAVLAKPNVEASLAAYNQAVAAANAALAEYPTVTVGGEYDALKAALAADKGSTVESIDAATKAIKEATPVFSASAPSYIEYVEEKYAAENIGCPTGKEPTTAEEAVEAYQTLKMNEYEYVTDNYTFNQTKLIGDFPDWDSSATVNDENQEYGTNSNEHWSGETKTYYEQASAAWGASAWTLLFEKTVTLPAGDYMLKVAARASAGTAATMTCSEAAADVTLPHKGAGTKGIDIDGNANYGDGDFVNNGNGFGWEWCYLPFSVTSERDVTFTFEVEAKTNYQWVSLCDVSLLSKEDVATGITNVGSENVFGTEDIFNLQGQKVGKAQKGVFIMNGKKVVVK